MTPAMPVAARLMAGRLVVRDGARNVEVGWLPGSGLFCTACSPGRRCSHVAVVRDAMTTDRRPR